MIKTTCLKGEIIMDDQDFIQDFIERIKDKIDKVLMCDLYIDEVDLYIAKCNPSDFNIDVDCVENYSYLNRESSECYNIIRAMFDKDKFIISDKVDDVNDDDYFKYSEIVNIEFISKFMHNNIDNQIIVNRDTTADPSIDIKFITSDFEYGTVIINETILWYSTIYDNIDKLNISDEEKIKLYLAGE